MYNIHGEIKHLRKVLELNEPYNNENYYPIFGKPCSILSGYRLIVLYFLMQKISEKK